jgi:hypothetical protein
LYILYSILYIVVKFPVWRPEWRPNLGGIVQYARYASQLRGYCTVSGYASQLGVPNGVPNGVPDWRPEWRPKLGVRIRVPNWASRYASRMSYLLRCQVLGVWGRVSGYASQLGGSVQYPDTRPNLGGIVQYPDWRPEWAIWVLGVYRGI